MRVCAFCGGVADSREHAWPDWLLKSVGHDAAGRIEAQLGADAKTRRWANRPIVVKSVCGQCNQGWMSALEGAVRPQIGAMASDISVRLTPDDQFRIALWGVKTAIMFGCAAPQREWFYTFEERQAVRAGRIPRGTKVWIGRHGQSQKLLMEARNLSQSLPDPDSPLQTGFSSTLTASHFVIQTLTVRLKPGQVAQTVRFQGRPGQWGTALFQVSPSTGSVEWPPATSFTSEEDLEHLSARFKSEAPSSGEI